MPWYQIRAAVNAKDGTSADILIFGEIGESWWSDETVTAKKLVEELAALDVDTLNIRINSYGGAVSDGLAIYNALRRHRAEKRVTVEGVAVSIASLIAMAGDTIDMPANCLMMIHAPWGFVQGNATDMRETADVLDRYATAMASSYVRKSGQSQDAILALLNDGKDHWYTADEAKAAGFADTVSDAIDAQASLPPRFQASAPSFIATGVLAMPDKTAPKAQPQQPTPAAPVPAAAGAQPLPDNVVQIQDAARREALAADQARRQAIKALLHGSLARRPELVEVLSACMDDINCSVDMASQRLLKKMGEGAESIGGAGAVALGADARDKFIQAGQNAILGRCGVEKPDGANPFRGFRLHELARACLQAVGGNVGGLLPEEFVPVALGKTRRAYASLSVGQTASDFPLLLEGAIHRIVLNGFKLQPTTWEKFCKVGDVTDFRAWKRLVPGSIGVLDPVNEHGEYLNKSLPDAEANSISVKRHGNIVTVTPEVIVNDDLGLIRDAADNYGRSGARTIERYVYLLLASNPVLSDGIPLFHGSHGNLAAAGVAPSMAAIDAARIAMSMHILPGGEADDYLDIMPTIALVGSGALGTFTQILNAEFDPTQPGAQLPNIVRNLISTIVSTPRIGSAWYLFADPNVSPVIEVAFLNGQREPRVVEAEDFRTEGISWRITLPFGVGAIDYRGVYKNPGA